MKRHIKEVKMMSGGAETSKEISKVEKRHPRASFQDFIINKLHHQHTKTKQISTSKQNMDPIMQQKAQAMQGQSNYSGGCT